MAEKETFAFRLENDTAEDVEAYIEERGVNKTDVLRRATKEYIDKQAGEDTTATGGSVSPLTILGAIAVGTVLLTTGHGGVGTAVVAIGGAFAFLWATSYDVVLEEALLGARDSLRKTGGVVDFFRHVINRYSPRRAFGVLEDHTPGEAIVDEPNTILEHATRLRVLAFAFLTSSLVVMIPVGLAYWGGALDALLALIGPSGALSISLLFGVLLSLASIFMTISAIAAIAIASAASPTDTPVRHTDPDA